jgi:hypothetical protein
VPVRVCNSFPLISLNWPTKFQDPSLTFEICFELACIIHRVIAITPIFSRAFRSLAASLHRSDFFEDFLIFHNDYETPRAIFCGNGIASFVRIALSARKIKNFISCSASCPSPPASQTADPSCSTSPLPQSISSLRAFSHPPRSAT